MPESRRDDLEQTIIAGLPGAEASYNRETIRNLIAEYEGVTAAELRSNLIAFLREVVPVAEESGFGSPYTRTIRPGRCSASRASSRPPRM
jgi:mannonate dehydratase